MTLFRNYIETFKRLDTFSSKLSWNEIFLSFLKFYTIRTFDWGSSIGKSTFDDAKQISF